MRAPTHALALVLVAAAGAPADISLDDAWRLAQAHADVPLAREPVEGGRFGETVARFAPEAGQASSRICSVDLVRGQWIGFDEDPPALLRTVPMTDDETLDPAITCFYRHSRELLGAVSWRRAELTSIERETHPDWVVWVAAPDPLDDAPEAPASACQIICSGNTGAVVSCTRYVATPHTPSRPGGLIPWQEAVAAGRKRIPAAWRGYPRADLRLDDRGRPIWRTVFYDEATDGGATYVNVDALSGEVLGVTLWR